jgi:hypothetical protein
MALLEAMPNIPGSYSRIYTPDLLTIFLLTYYNWIIFFIGVYLILYATRRLFFPEKHDPLDFEERQLSLWDRFMEWVKDE